MDIDDLIGIIPEIEDDDFSALDVYEPWVKELFCNSSCPDDILTDVVLQNIKVESFNNDIYDFVNNMVVEDEIEVNNTANVPLADIKSDLFSFQRDNTTNISFETSGEYAGSPEFGSCGSTSSTMSGSVIDSLNLKTSPKENNGTSMDTLTIPNDIHLEKNEEYTSDFNSNNCGREHYVLHKAPRLVTVGNASKLHNKNELLSVQSGLKDDGYRSKYLEKYDAVDFVRINSFTQKSSTSSQTSSDTDTGAPVAVTRRKDLSANCVANSQNRIHSSFRLHSGISTNRYQNPSNTSHKRVDDFDAPYPGDVANIRGGSPDNFSSASGHVYRQPNLFLNGLTQPSGSSPLTEEERRTLISEGYPLPERFPLSKQEERILKKIRRKIKNKISAQESRRKKKEYVETLERRMEIYTQENTELKRRLDGLEGTNRSLLGQLRHLQQLVNKSTNLNSTSNLAAISSLSNSNKRSPVSENHNTNSSRTGSASTYLMVFLLCFSALFAGQPKEAPNYPSSLSVFQSPRSDNFLGDFSSIVSLSQIGYTWSGTNLNARIRNKSDPTDGHLKYHLQETNRYRWRQEIIRRDRTSNLEEVSKQSLRPSRLLGLPKEDCEPLTWWDYLFGTSDDHLDGHKYRILRVVDSKDVHKITQFNFTPSFNSINANQSLNLKNNFVLSDESRLLYSVPSSSLVGTLIQSA